MNFFKKQSGQFIRLAICLMLVSCNFSDEYGNASPDKKSLGLDVSANVSDFDKLMNVLFAPECSDCHNHGRSAGGVNLTTLETIVNGQSSLGPLVVAGNSNASAIYKVIETGEMPPSGDISNDVLTLLQCWIDSGAEQSSFNCQTSPAKESPSTGSNATPNINSKSSNAPCECDDKLHKHSDDDDCDENEHESGNHENENSGENENGGGSGNSGNENSGGSGNEGSSGGTGGGTPEVITFAKVTEEVFEPYGCLNCHNANRARGGIDLSQYKKIVGDEAIAGLVNLDDPESSLVYVSIFEEYMPPRGDAVSSTNQMLVLNWIRSGAPE